MALTPVDISHTQFKTAIKGYDRGQVDAFVKEVSQSLEELLTQKNDLLKRVDELESEVQRVRGIESTMVEALTLAQKTADEVKETAHRRAEMMLREAEQERVRMTVEAQRDAEKCRAEIELLQATRDRFESEFRAVLRGYGDWLDRRNRDDEVRSEVA